MLQPTRILTELQRRFLDEFSNSSLVDAFYLTGGTALCGFYLPYRYSEDLDFFSKEEFDLPSVVAWIKSVKRRLGFDSFEVNTSFNRQLIFLHFPDTLLIKTEFTFFPFEPKSRGGKYKNIVVDSIEDLALNKLFTIYQNPRLRDYMDLFVILTEYQELDFPRVVSDSRIKFDWQIDLVQLGSQLLKSKDLKDVPRLADSFDWEKMHLFYEELAKGLGSDVFALGSVGQKIG